MKATQDSLNAFLNSNPGAAAKMGKYQQAMSNMAQPIQQMYQGGPVRGFDAGGAAVDGQTDPAGHTFHLDGTEHIPESTAQPIVDNRPDTFTGGKFSYADTVVPMFAGAVQQTMQPVQGAVNYITPQPADFIGSTAGQTAPIAPMAEAATIGNVTQSQMAQTKGAGTYGTTGVAPSVATAVEGGRNT